MTIEQWTDERLDQLAEDVDDLRASTADLRTTAEIMLQTLTQHQQNFDIVVNEIKDTQQNFDIVVNEIKDIKADIKGLQLENRRMLEELRGRRNGEDA